VISPPRLEIQTSPRTVPCLAVLVDLFDRLHAEEIRYCHWKSTEHLGASLEGTTDLDVLIDRNDAARFARVLAETDFQAFRELNGRGYPGVEDYVGFDPASGRLTHVHAHYQLTLGEKFLKGYRLPWEETALATRVWDPAYGLYVVEPALEAVMLVTRAALKVRGRDYILAAAGKTYFRGGAARELRWLARRVDPERLRARAAALVGERAAALLGRMVAQPPPSIVQLLAFRRSVTPSLAGYRLYGAITARRRRWARELSWIWVALRNRARGLPKRSTRTAAQGGLAIAVTGPQAPATALARALLEWLSPQMAVLPNLGERDSAEAHRARGRGLIVIADRLRTGAPRPDLIVDLSQADALDAKQRVWDRLRGRP